MKCLPLMLSVLALPALLSCSSNPNSMLIFGDNAHIGLHVGANAATGGGAFNVGYKHRSVALVPVSVLNSDGVSDAIRSDNGEASDALSVFAVFESSANKAAEGDGQTRVGQIFSTGSAAQSITAGFKCRAEGKTDCVSTSVAAAPPPKDAASSSEAASSFAAAAAASADKAAASAEEATSSAAAAALARQAAPKEKSKGPFQTPLIYARTDLFGLDIGGSLQDTVTSQENGFTLGYSSRNLALVPVYRESADYHVDALYSRPTRGKDAFSVLGQFQAKSGLTGVTFGLERFFATGMAAANLADGLKATIAKGHDTTPAAPAAAASQ